MRQAISIAVLLSGVLVATFASEAQAFHHCRCSCWPVKYLGYGPCGCPGPYCFAPGCGSSAGCWFCCGPAYCPRTHHCCIKTWMHSLCLKHQAHKQARWNACCWSSCCWNSCGWDCCGSSCGGGCSNGGAALGGESNPETIYDGPASGAPSPDEAAPSEASNWRGVPYRLVSNSTARQDGTAAFDRGLTSFRSRSMNDALASFNVAVRSEPNNAMYQYYRALTLFDLNGGEAAGDALRQAIELERQQPVENWGKRMERVQGRGRVWVEDARRAAGLIH